MPPRFVPTPSPRCPRCTKAVYLAEQVIGPNGTSWHKSCFTCERCNRRLDSTTLAEHEGKAYCQACHKLVFGPTGYGYGSGLLVPEDPENQFKQSIGRPVNREDSNEVSGGFGSTYQGEAEEQRRERLTPVNATAARRNSLEMIREQAEASRRAYDEAHAQRLAGRHVNPNLTGGSSTSTGSRGEPHTSSGYGLSSGYVSGGSDSSSAFGSTMATTSSPAPSVSSISSAASSQPATKSLYLNQPIKPSSGVSSPHRRESSDADSDYARSRQALSFQTGAPPVPSGPPSLPKRTPESTGFVRSSHTGDKQDQESYLEYAPIRVVARKEEPRTPSASTPEPAAQSVADDEWDTEPAQKPQEPPMYLSQYLKQQRQKERDQASSPSGPPSLPKRNPEPVRSVSRSHTGDNQGQDPYLGERKEDSRAPFVSTQPAATSVADDEWDAEPTREKPQEPVYISQYLKEQRQATREPEPAPSVSSSGRSNHLLSEADRRNMREQEERQRQAQAGSGSVEADEWDEEPTPTVPSKPANLSYYQSTPAPIKKAHPVFGGGDICRSCQKVVYHAELARAHGSVYHKACLRCFSCQKSVDATNMVDRQGTPYCRHCYSREFGAKGYGYGAGGHVLHTEL
ncbi:hypothetical protein BGX31_002628 [Mortierella sp. GBA43]|nr:hypothetical protein BGX31_002628 [Mortierella sp. GBA43]